MTITKQFIKENYDKFFDYFNDNDAHPEFFYNWFYDEHIAGEISEETKQEWMSMWKEDDYDEEITDETTFDEFIDDYNDCKWDITGTYIFCSDWTEMKDKAIDSIFTHIEECWNENAKQHCFDAITSN